MSDPIFPLAVWQSGTNENSLPANDNALRIEALSREVISKVVTSQPVSPSDGDVYIIPSGATGAQWSSFDVDDLTIYRGGTWYAWAPINGIVVNLAGDLYQFDGSSGWVAVGGGGGGGNLFVNVMLSDMTTNLTTGTDSAYWVAPESGTLVDVWIGLIDPSSSGIVRIDLNKNVGGTVLSTRPAIDATESTSLTGTSAVISTPSFSKGDFFRFDIDDAGTDAKGLQAVLEYTP
jgi:hypothetical protein